VKASPHAGEARAEHAGHTRIRAFYPVPELRGIPPLRPVDAHRLRPVARQHVMCRYLEELVWPVARRLGISDLAGWLRPYLVMRLLAVYDPAALNQDDTALTLAHRP
jgi:hypothetical protein